MQKLKKTGGKAKMTIPSLSKQSNVEERWGQVTSTTYERWRKRNWQKMDAWIRGTDPATLERQKKENERLARYEQKRKAELDGALKRIQKQKGISRLKAMKYLRQQTAKGKKISQLGRSGG